MGSLPETLSQPGGAYVTLYNADPANTNAFNLNVLNIPNSRADTAFVSSGHVYIAGWVYPYPAYSVDGALHKIASSPGYWLYAVTVSGSDVYAMGADYSDTTYVYWKNDVLQTLPFPTGVSFKNERPGGITVTNGHVYVAGAGMDGGGHQIPILWRDGTPIQLGLGPGDTDGGWQGDIISTSTLAYVYGSTYSTTTGHTAVWTDDGTTTTATFITPGGNATDGVVSADIAYIAGWSSATATSAVAGYENMSTATTTAVTDLAGSPGSLAEAIAVSGTNVYLAGETNDRSTNPPSLPVYWAPGGSPTQLPLPSNASTGSATHIAVSGSGDIYIVGYPVSRAQYYSASNPVTPLIWKNGSLVGSSYLPLPSGDTGAVLDSGTVMVSSGNDVYLVGVTGIAPGTGFSLDFNKQTHAVYWKNGVLTVLPIN